MAMKKISIGFVIIVFMLTGSCKFIRQKGWFGTGKDTMALYQQRMDSIRVADSLKRIEEEQQRLEQAFLDSVQQAEEEQRFLEEQYRYHIIVGGFITPEYADDYAAYYASEGFQPQILTAENGFDLISVMDLDNLAEARRMVENFRDTVDIDTWLYIYPPLE